MDFAKLVISLLDSEKKRMLKDGIESCTRRREAVLADTACNCSRDGRVRHRRKCNVGGVHKKLGGFPDLTVEEAIHLKTLVKSALGETSMSPAADAKSVRSRKDSGPSHQIDDPLGQSTRQRPVEFQDDPLCRVFATLGALSLQRVLLVMASRFPRSLRILVMDILSPAAAELLTRKFEELDGILEPSLQPKFYEMFYSVFDSPEAGVAILLEKKEEFAAQALQNVLSQFLGLSCCPARA